MIKIPNSDHKFDSQSSKSSRGSMNIIENNHKLLREMNNPPPILSIPFLPIFATYLIPPVADPGTQPSSR